MVCKPYYLPIDLIARKGVKARSEALLGLAAHMRFRPNFETVRRWANEWPECTNGEDRTKGLVPDLTPMIEKLREIGLLKAFLVERGYELDWL